MKPIKAIAAIVLGIAVCLEAASPVFAASRSHSVDVSCVVKPVFQISSPLQQPAQGAKDSDPLGGFQPAKRSELGVSGAAKGIHVQSNLTNTRVNTEIRKIGGADVRVYSVTVI